MATSFSKAFMIGSCVCSVGWLKYLKMALAAPICWYGVLLPQNVIHKQHLYNYLFDWNSISLLEKMQWSLTSIHIKRHLYLNWCRLLFSGPLSWWFTLWMLSSWNFRKAFSIVVTMLYYQFCLCWGDQKTAVKIRKYSWTEGKMSWGIMGGDWE